MNDPGNPIEITMENQEIDAGTYTLSETGPPGFEFVLISGDTGCPTMVKDMEEFTISEGEHLTCVIYNDDDADEGAGGAGVAFGFNGFDFTVLAPNGPVTGLNTCASQPLGEPCIEKNGILYVIVDPLLVNVNNSIIVWSMTPMAGSPTNQVNNCSLTSIIPSTGHLGENGFALFCSTVVAGTWNINYAFINT